MKEVDAVHKVLTAILVAGLALGLAGQALAAPDSDTPDSSHLRRHAIFGQVQSDATITVASGGSFVLTTRQGNFQVLVTPSTAFQVTGQVPTTPTPATVRLKAGITAAAVGRVPTGTGTPVQFAADRVIVLGIVVAVGTVKTAPGTPLPTTLVVTTNRGDVTFRVTTATVVRPASSTLANVVVGTRLVVRGQYDLATGDTVAQQIVIRAFRIGTLSDQPN